MGIIILQILTILAIFAGPFFAVWAQWKLQLQREERDHKIAIYKTLMTTRATPLSPTHVNALNSIQIEFSPKDSKENAVINAWKDLHDHFAVPITDENQAAWHSKRWDLHIDLLYLMGQTLGYNFTRSNLRQDIYTPLGITDLETQERTLRDNLADILAGKKDLPVLVKKVD